MKSSLADASESSDSLQLEGTVTYLFKVVKLTFDHHTLHTPYINVLLFVWPVS